jgi:hypothetical protein
MMIRPDGFERLPKKWQTHIESMERNEKSLRDRLDEQLGVADELTRNTIVGYGDDPARPILEHATIRFRFGPSFEDYLEVSRNYEKGGGLTIRGGHCVMIEPRASNTAIVHSMTPFAERRPKEWIYG